MSAIQLLPKADVLALAVRGVLPPLEPLSGPAIPPRPGKRCIVTGNRRTYHCDWGNVCCDGIRAYCFSRSKEMNLVRLKGPFLFRGKVLRQHLDLWRQSVAMPV
jgi:hypothetical protein